MIYYWVMATKFTITRGFRVKAAYGIGEKVWHNGDEVTITTEAYELYGAVWQDGTTESGKTKTVLAPKCKAEADAKHKQETADDYHKFDGLNLNV
jgi:hypothetical protein